MRKIIVFIILAASTLNLQLISQSNYIRLTEHPDIDAYPVFSPNGDKIYFHSTRNSSNKTMQYGSIWMMENDGSEETEIIKINPPLTTGTISPPVSFLDNSDTMFLKEVASKWEIFSIDLLKITNFPEIKYYQNGSEGKFKVLLDVPGAIPSTNFIYNKVTSEVLWVTTLTSIVNTHYTTYSIRKAKLKNLNGQSTLSTGTEIFRTSVKGLMSLFDNQPISLSPDCNKLVVAMIIDSNGCNKCQKDLYIIDINNGAVIKQLTTDGANRVNHEYPRWSPDGQWISFTSNLDGSNSIWIIRPDGTDLTRLTSDTTNDYGASWSPDSKQIAFTSVKNGNHDIYLLEIDKCKAILGTESSVFENKKIKYNELANFDSTNKSVIMNPSQSWCGGSIWYDKKLPVQKGFSTEFAFRLTDGIDEHYDEKYPGADGIAFVIQNEDNNAIGSFGGGIGYANIPNSLAIEFDTYKNTSNLLSSGINDPNENHIAVLCNKLLPNISDHGSMADLITNDKIMDIVPDGRIYYSKIEYNLEPNTLKVWLDSNSMFQNPPIVTLEDLNLSELLDLTCDEFAWMGFTSATGIAYEKHEIISWSLCIEQSSLIIPNPEITNGKDSVCEGNVVIYKSNTEYNIDYHWIVESGTIISGQNTNEITVKWGAFDNGKIILTHKSKETGCINSITKQIFIQRLPDVQISGSNDFCIDNISTFKASNIDGVSLIWKVVGGEILGSNNLDSIQVLWNNTGKKKITLLLNYLDCKEIDSLEKNIEVYSLPEIIFDEMPNFCLTDLPVDLDIASPKGGKYLGKGITSNILFPKDAGVGTHDIFYTYTDPQTNCKNSAKSKFTILDSPEKPTITQNQKKLICTHSYGYQWFNEKGMIEGAINQEYIPDKSGQYYVILVDENGCKSEMSDPYYFDITEVKNSITEDIHINIFPNPASDEIIIESIGDKAVSVLEIQDVLGRVVNFQINYLDFNHISIKTNNFESGLYLLTLKDNVNNHRKMFCILR